MNYRVTLGFLVAAAVLAVLVVGLDKFNIGPTSTANANATSTTTAAQQPQIYSFDDSKVTALELRQADKSVKVSKQGSDWVVADGSGDPANRTSFSSLVTRMSQLKATRAVDNLDNKSTDLSQYGLDTPKDVAIATLDDGTTYELDLGSKTPVQTGTYAKKSDAPDVYVIADQFQTDLERLVTDPRQPTPTVTGPTAAVPGVATPLPPLGTPTP